MIPYERQKLILKRIELHDFLYIEDIISIFPNYSESTIRRDLKKLEERNEVELLHGGGIKRTKNINDIPINEKIYLNNVEKEIIGKKAALEVKDNDLIYVDSGTTPLKIIKHITASNVTIVTTNTTVIKQEINPKIEKIILVSGIFNPLLDSISGTLTDEALKEIFFNKAFIGATGFGINIGITTPDIKEATKKRIVKNNSNTTYVLADDSKLNKKAAFKAFDLNDCLLITNSKIDVFEKNNTNYIF